jgi:hypothetical protein
MPLAHQGDDTRDLLDNVQYALTRGCLSTIDEVHMLAHPSTRR